MRTDPWSPEDLQRLRDLAPTHTARELAATFGRSRLATLRRLQSLGLRAGRVQLGGRHLGTTVKPWTKQDDYELLMTCGEFSMGDLAKRFGRSKNALTIRLQKLGIDRTTGRYPVDVVARVLGVSMKTVCDYRDRLGFRFGRTSRGTREPSATIEHIQAIAQAILNNPATEITVPAPRLRRIAAGDIDV